MSYYRIIRRNASSEPWTPSALSDLTIWLDASDDSTLRAGITVGSTASTDGGAVGMWVNKVDSTKGIWGHSHWWSATRQTSAVNGKTVVRLADQSNFTTYGSNTREYPLSSPVSALTIAIVKKLPSTLVGSTEFSINHSGGPDAGYIGITTWSSKIHWHLGLPTSGTLNASPKSGTVTGGTTYLMIGRYEGSVSSALYMDGSLAESVSNPAASIAIATGSGIDQAMIGTAYGGHKGAVGDNCEILVCESALSTTDRQRLEGYLAHKWGLTGSLPSDHPHKSSAPTV